MVMDKMRRNAIPKLPYAFGEQHTDLLVTKTNQMKPKLFHTGLKLSFPPFSWHDHLWLFADIITHS